LTGLYEAAVAALVAEQGDAPGPFGMNALMMASTRE
jgi:hypothetical protein